MHDLPCVLVPGGSTLPPTDGEDLGKVQTIGARYSNNELSLEDAARLGCRACGSAGGGCQFLGTAGTSQVVAEGLGLALPHTALAPSGEPVWVEVGRQSAKAVMGLLKKGITIKDIITDKAIENAMFSRCRVLPDCQFWVISAVGPTAAIRPLSIAREAFSITRRCSS